TLVCSASERETEPLPSLDAVESPEKILVGTAALRIGTFDLPKKLSMPESSVLERLRCVWLAIAALSVKFTMTVRMSPTIWARWSLKKAREPERHSEFGL